MANEQGRAFFGAMMSKAMPKGKEGQNMNVSEAMMKMLGSFTVIRMVGMMGAAGLKMTKEELLAMNAELNKIKK